MPSSACLLRGPKCRGHGVPIGLLNVYIYSVDRHKLVYYDDDDDDGDDRHDAPSTHSRLTRVHCDAPQT